MVIRRPYLDCPDDASLLRMMHGPYETQFISTLCIAALGERCSHARIVSLNLA